MLNAEKHFVYKIFVMKIISCFGCGGRSLVVLGKRKLSFAYTIFTERVLHIL